jgi:hypothetical protein
VLFNILSQHGKDIQEVAKFGRNNPANEMEVLFRPNSQFLVRNITKNEDGLHLIIMEEI